MPEKQDLQSAGDRDIEQTHSGPTLTPEVDIFETEGVITVLADMPGVKAEDLRIDLSENVLTLTGKVRPAEGDKETDVFREYGVGTYFRRFTLAETVDQSKIEASLKDGVLRLDLPKIEAVKPRKITVKTA